MTQGLATVLFPVKDLAASKALFTLLLGAEPMMDQPYYVGWRIGDLDVGLDPSGAARGMTGTSAYWRVDDIAAMHASLQAAGCTETQGPTDVGGGRKVSALKDPDGNIIGLLQDT